MHQSHDCKRILARNRLLCVAAFPGEVEAEACRHRESEPYGWQTLVEPSFCCLSPWLPDDQMFV